MKNHVPNEVSYKAARALAYLMTRKWWKELRDTYYKLEDNLYKETGLSIEDWILTNADINTVVCIIPWDYTDTNAITWSKRHRKFQKLWTDNFNGNPEETEKTSDGSIFKVGDKVRVKRRTKNGDKYWGCFTEPMAELVGTVCTVKGVEKMKRSSNLGCLPDDGYFYDLDDDSHKSCNYFWASSMLEKA